MPILTKDEGTTMKAEVYDLSEQGAKQVLYALIAILEQHPSVLTAVFTEILADGLKYTKLKG